MEQVREKEPEANLRLSVYLLHANMHSPSTFNQSISVLKYLWTTKYSWSSCFLFAMNSSSVDKQMSWKQQLVILTYNTVYVTDQIWSTHAVSTALKKEYGLQCNDPETNRRAYCSHGWLDVVMHFMKKCSVDSTERNWNDMIYFKMHKIQK